jgi:hypothetical protein
VEEYKKQGVKLLDKYPLHYSASHIFDLLFYLLGDLKIVLNYGHTVFIKTVDEKIDIIVRINFNVPENTSLFFYFMNNIIYEFSPMEKLSVYRRLKKEGDEYIREVIYSSKEENVFKAGLIDQVKEFLGNYDNDLATLDDASKVSNFCNTLMRVE